MHIGPVENVVHLSHCRADSAPSNLDQLMHVASRSSVSTEPSSTPPATAESGVDVEDAKPSDASRQVLRI